MDDADEHTPETFTMLAVAAAQIVEKLKDSKCLQAPAHHPRDRENALPGIPVSSVDRGGLPTSPVILVVRYSSPVLARLPALA